MPRYIDANKLLTKVHRYHDYLTDEWFVPVRDIEDAPTADVVERKKGRWLNKGRKMCCSVCGHVNFCTPNFCDECGTDMRKEEDNAKIH